VQFGRGPATVIGSLFAVSQDTHQCCGSRALFARKSAAKPQSVSWGFFVAGPWLTFCSGLSMRMNRSFLTP
jgi:hypothetical protein